MKASILRNMALLGLAALAAVATAASDDARAVRQLQEKTGAVSLIPMTANRQEIALALADVAATSGQPQADLSGWNSKDYDALFALLQQYREELAALGLKQAGVDAAMEALRKRVADLEARMEYLPPDGMKIHGGFNVLTDDLLITGPGVALGSGSPTRYRRFKQYVDLEFTAIHGPFLGITEVDLVNYVGSYAAPEPLGIRRVYAELRTPIAMQSGDFTIKYTPLTLWRNEDEDPYVPEPYKGRINRLRSELLLADDHAHLLRGLRFLTDMVVTESHVLELEAYASKLDAVAATVYVPADPVTGLDSTIGMLANYDTYVVGWKVASEVVPGWHVGYVGVKMFEEKDTSGLIWVSPPLGHPELTGKSVDSFDNEVHSASTSFSMLDDLVSGNAEYAISRYANPNIGYSRITLMIDPTAPKYAGTKDWIGGGYLPGTAMTASLSVGPKWAKLTGTMRQVDESFIAPAAQTRTFDRNRSIFGPLYTENSTFNPHTGAFGGFSSDSFPWVEYPETQFNRRIVPPAWHDSTNIYRMGYLLPSDPGFEAGSPYGLATPNRSGYGAELAFNFWNGGFQPDVKVDMSQEIVGQGFAYDAADAPIPSNADFPWVSRPPEKYMMARFGMILDLKPLLSWPLRFISGYRIETINADAPWAPELAPSFSYPDGLPAAQVNFDSTRLDLGMEYYPVKSTGLFLGFRHLDYNGTIYNVATTYQPRGQFGLQEEYETTGVGLRHLMGGDRIVIDLLYTNQTFPDRNLALTQGKVVAYEIEQLYSKIAIRF